MCRPTTGKTLLNYSQHALTAFFFFPHFCFQAPGGSLAVHSLPAKLVEFLFQSRNLWAKRAVPHGPHKPESHIRSRCAKNSGKTVDPKGGFEVGDVFNKHHIFYIFYLSGFINPSGKKKLSQFGSFPQVSG